MAYEAVKVFFEQKGFADRLTLHDSPSDTVENAARTVGCSVGQIAKTMSFLCETPIVIVCTGDAKIDNAKYKAFFGKKAKMVPWDQVQSIIGHEPGGVCPFALPADVKVYFDASLKRFDDVHIAAGAPAATAHVFVKELDELVPDALWVDVCKLADEAL